MALRSLTPEELERARNTRQQILVAKWMRRSRISRAELDEIRVVIGEEEYAKALIEQENPATPDPFSDRAEYVHRLTHYEKIFKRSVRQIKRWIKAGRLAKPPELPPLDEPGKMLDWWHRMVAAEQLTQSPPPVLEQFAIEAAKLGPSSGAGAGELGAIDISKLETVQGIELKQAYSFLAATGMQLETAYANANDALITRIQKRWKDALDAVRMAEDSQRKAQKATGELLARPEVISELLVLIETLASMQRTMSRRIRARFGVLPPEIDAKLDEVIEAERARECAALRRAKVFSSIDEVILELDTAACVAV
jgi:hypothetical protein